MRVLLIALLIVLMPVRGWIGQSMAMGAPAQLPPSHLMVMGEEHVSSAASASKSVGGTGHAMGASHANCQGDAAATTETSDANLSSTLSECKSCSACQSCQGAALVASGSSGAAMPLPRDDLFASAAQFANAEHKSAFKPPIS